MNTATTPTPEDFDPAPRRGPELPPDPTARALAEKLGCVVDDDVCALARVKPSTTEAWRKRGDGPPYVLFGNRPLYPIEALRKFLEGKVRERRAAGPSLL